MPDKSALQSMTLMGGFGFLLLYVLFGGDKESMDQVVTEVSMNGEMLVRALEGLAGGLGLFGARRVLGDIKENTSR